MAKEYAKVPLWEQLLIVKCTRDRNRLIREARKLSVHKLVDKFEYDENTIVYILRKYGISRERL